MRCVPGAHFVRSGNVHTRVITSELIQAYKHCCMIKRNANDEIAVDQEVHICTSCWVIICREYETPTELAMEQDNIFPYNSPIAIPEECFLCNRANPLYQIQLPARVDFFLKTGLFISTDMKCCREHVCRNENEFNIDVHFLQLQSEVKIIRMKPSETAEWFTSLRTAGGTVQRTSMLNRILSLSDDDFRQVTGIKRHQYQNLCDISCGFQFQKLKCKPLSVMLLLMKLRNAQYLLFLKALFGFSCKRTVSSEIKIARLAIMDRFVPRHLGPNAHVRPDCYVHTNELAKKLHLSPDNAENVVLVVDGTYVYIPKSSNFTVLKRSYSQHKGRHLLKMTMLVFSDGTIFDVHGPYLSDGKNNDSSTLKHDLQKNISGLKDWLQEGDVFVLDRGYRDAVAFLASLGLNVSIPFCSTRTTRQVPTQNANDSRITTRTRWIVEVRNGHVSQIFKYFGRTIHAGSVPFIGDYFRIACALINAYYPPITLSEASIAAGSRMLALRETSNILMQTLEERGLLNFRIKRIWRKMQDEELEDFPRIDEDGLHSLTLSVFQIRLAPSYVAAQDFNFEVFREEADLLRVKVESRHSSSTTYYIFIRFRPNVNGEDGIVGWYCSCKGGTRTVGMCSHTCAILWYLCFARYQPSIPAPSNRVLEIALDAAERFNNIVVLDDDVESV